MSVITNGNNSRILQPYDRLNASGSVGEIPLHVCRQSEHVPRIHHALEYIVIFFFTEVLKIPC